MLVDIFAMSDALLLSTQILQGNAAFTNKLYQILARKPGSVFFSPLSIHIVLSMVYQGALEETAKVLAEVLQIPDAKSTALGYKMILDRVANTENAILHLANKIYVREGEELLEQFERDVREYFSSEVDFLNFEKKAETVEKINQWVLQQTKEKIKDIVDEDSIDEDTAMFLLNAIYFKADWEEKFSENSTKICPFYLDDEKTVEVEMMRGTKKILYQESDDLKAEVLSLPYKGKKVSLVIILPNEKTGIRDLEAKLASSDLTQMLDNLYSTKVHVSLPKFKFETTIELEDVVKEMGLGLIFNERKANFKGMLKLEPREKLCVDKILQKACIDVNEEGSEAAVVTVVRMRKAKCEEEIVTFVVDHPAIFMVVEGEGIQKNILFYGRLFYPKY